MHHLQILALPQLAVLYINHCDCQLMDGLYPAAVSTAITRLDIEYSSSIQGAFLAALPQLRHLDIWEADVESVEAINRTLGSLQQLSYISLYWNCTTPPASLACLTNLRRLYIFADTQPEEGLHEEGGLPPPGAWSSGLQ